MDGQHASTQTLTAAARVGSLAHYSAKNSRTFVRVLAIDLSEDAKGRAGSLNGVLRAEMPSAVGESLTAHIEDALMRGIVDSLRRLPADADQETLFEASIGKVNESLRRLLGYDGPFHGGEGRVNGLLFSQCGTDVVAAVWGRPSLLLFHRAVSGKTKVFDLLDDEEEKGVGIGFTKLIAGSLGKNDTMLAATEDLRNAVGADNLAEIVGGGEPAAAAAAIREALMMGKSTISAAMFILKTEDQSVAKGTDRDSTQHSIDNLLATAHRTRDIISASPLTMLTKSASSLLKGLVKRKETSHQDDAAPAAPPEIPLVPPIEATAPKSDAKPAAELEPRPEVKETAAPRADEQQPSEAAAAPRSVMAAALMGSRPVVFKPQAVFEDSPAKPDVATKKATSVPDANVNEKPAETVKSPPTETRKRGMSAVLAAFNSLTATSRGLLLATMTLAIVFNYSLAATGLERRLSVAAASYDDTVTKVSQKLDSAEASLIYRDEARALQLIGEAEALIDTLPTKTAQQKTVVDDLRRKVEVKRLSLRRAVALEPPESVTALGSGLTSPKLEKISMAGNVIWSVAANGEIYKTDASSGKTDPAGKIDAPGADIFAATDSGLFAGGVDAVKLIGNSGQSYDRIMPATGEKTEVTDSSTWNSKLYLLDAQHNRILKLTPAGKGFAEPQFFVKDGTDLSKARSIAIDGNVWVLSYNGRLDKLTRGVRENFDVEAVDPPLNHAVRLRTDTESDKLYVLDAAPARLVMFSKKDGSLLAQYVSDSLKGASDFVVSADGKSATFAVEDKLVKFSLPAAQ